MGDIVNPKQTGLAPFLGGLAGRIGTGNLPYDKPFSQEIFLIATHVAGTMYVDGIEQLVAPLEKGTKLFFFREPDNPVDAHAILIVNEQQVKLGYVPRANNEILARLMDAGKFLYGMVEEKENVGEWTKLSLKIFMKDL
jgi:hypothetical protein